MIKDLYLNISFLNTTPPGQQSLLRSREFFEVGVTVNDDGVDRREAVHKERGTRRE